MTFSIMALSILIKIRYTANLMLSFIMLNVVMLRVVVPVISRNYENRVEVTENYK
jgi:hypothetical protein